MFVLFIISATFPVIFVFDFGTSTRRIFLILDSETCWRKEHLGDQILSPLIFRVIFMRVHKEGETALTAFFYIDTTNVFLNSMPFISIIWTIRCISYRKNLFPSIPKSSQCRSHPLQSFVWVYLKGNNGRPCLIWFRAAASSRARYTPAEISGTVLYENPMNIKKINK